MQKRSHVQTWSGSCLTEVALLLGVIGLQAALGEAYPTNNFRDLDICNHWNGRRHFLELGERGDLHARNLTTSAFRSTIFSGSLTEANSQNRSSASIWYQCNLELVTCAECVIRITFTHVNFSHSCERSLSNGGVGGVSGVGGMGGPGRAARCPCEHIQFSEPPYDTTVSGQEFCGDGKVFRSKTRTLLLKFFYRVTNSHVFSLQYFSERNVQIVSGSPEQSIVTKFASTTGPQVISSPYFPMPYPRDYGIEHILTCEADDCRVRLDFTDFQLGLSSTLEIFDSNGQMLDSYTGEHFRPPITVSSGKSLLLRFRGNGVTGAGFHAEVKFVSSKQLKDSQMLPFTDCGGMVTGPGGAITMMNMIENASDVRYYDCIWIIKPGNNYMMMKTHISLRVEEFHGMASKSDLIIREGTTSNAVQVENAEWPNNGVSKENHITPILTGYYIRLRGVFGMSSKLAIVYSVFNYLNCYIGSEFLCNNNHCISIRLHCDGFDHCGDGSDEPESCEEHWAHLQNDRRWYSHKPNYYFPKTEQYPDLKTATGIFIISTLGIFTVLSGWMVILYRMGVRARHQRELQNHLQTISELLDRQDEDRPPDEPPSYEAPPDYDEVIKVGMEAEMREAHQHQCQRRPHRRQRECGCSRSVVNAATAQTMGGAIVPVHGCSDRPSTSNAAAASAQANNDGNIQDIANRVLRATALCGIAKSSGQAKERSYKSVGVSTSPLSLSSGGELSSSCLEQQCHEQQRSNARASTCGTSSRQLEEYSGEFKDDSLNISFTLDIPQSHPTTTSDNHYPIINEPSCARSQSAVNCPGRSQLKRSWFVVNNVSPQGKLQGLRHTFSLPETFPMDGYFQDVYNYGTTMPLERSIFVSNASNFGSELSRDPSAQSMNQQRLSLLQKFQHCILVHRPDHETPGSSDVGSYLEVKPLVERRNISDSSGSSCSTLHPNEDDTDDITSSTNATQQLLLAELESDTDDIEVSCFGAKNKRAFRGTGNVNGRGRQGRRRQHVRSKSWTQSVSQRQRGSFKRSSSADLLMSVEAISDCRNRLGVLV